MPLEPVEMSTGDLVRALHEFDPRNRFFFVKSSSEVILFEDGLDGLKRPWVVSSEFDCADGVDSDSLSQLSTVSISALVYLSAEDSKGKRLSKVSVMSDMLEMGCIV